MDETERRVVAPRRAWLILRIGLVVYLAATAFLATSYLQLYDFLDALLIEARVFPDPEARGAAIDRSTSIGVFVHLAAYAVSVVGYAMFYYRAMRNAQAFEPEHATVGPHAMYLWYAVPFASLWKPLEGVMQVWRASRRRAGLDDRVPVVVGVWWASWLFGGTVGSLLDRLHPGAQALKVADFGQPGEILTYIFLSACMFAVLGLSAIALWWISERIYKAQIVSATSPMALGSQSVPAE